MRVAIDCRAIGRKRTGDEVYTKNLVANLTKIDSENQYFLLFDRDNITNGDFGFSLPDNFKIITILPAQKLLWTMYSLPRWVKKNSIDVLHVQYIAPFWLPKSTKLITTIHDISWKFFPQYIKKSDLFFLNTLIPMSLKRANKIITVSETSKKDMINTYKIPTDKVASIYNGGGDSFGNLFLSDSSELNRVKQRYSLPNNFILYIGTLQPRKNIPSLLEAFNILISNFSTQDESALGEKIQNLKLVIAGGKSHNYDIRIDKLIAKYKLKDKILFPGYIEEQDLPFFYKLAKIFTYPSLHEGFGIPAIEAMSAGTPVIVSNKSCLPEVVGDAGMIIDPENSNEFAKAIYDLLTDEELKSKLTERGYKRAREFSWEKTARETLKTYKNI